MGWAGSRKACFRSLWSTVNIRFMRIFLPTFPTVNHAQHIPLSRGWTSCREQLMRHPYVSIKRMESFLLFVLFAILYCACSFQWSPLCLCKQYFWDVKQFLWVIYFFSNSTLFGDEAKKINPRKVPYAKPNMTDCRSPTGKTIKHFPGVCNSPRVSILYANLMGVPRSLPRLGLVNGGY